MPQGLKDEGLSHWIVVVLFTFALICFLAVTTGCGGSDSDGDGGGGNGSGDNNSILTGDFFTMHMEDSSSLTNQSNAVTFDGQGGYDGSILYDSAGDSGSYTGTYEVSSDNALTYSGTDMTGIVSADASTFAVVDTSPAGVDTSIALAIGTRTSSGMTASDLSGEYVVCQFRHDGSDPGTSLFTFNFDGTSALTGTYLADSDGSSGSLSGTYTVADDGGLGLTITGLAKVFQGYISADGKLIVILDIDDDGEVLLMVGLKTTTGADASLYSGDYQMNMISSDASSRWTSMVDTTADGSGNLSVSVVSDSDGDSGQYDLSYTVGTDGRLTITENGLSGVISSDGELFILADTDDSDGDVMIAVGIKE
jgi:hypothetical protein